MSSDDGVIHPVRRQLSPEVPLTVHIVRGERYSVLVDSGVAAMYDQIRESIETVLGDPRRLRLVVNTHAHHDHIGCNEGVSALTGALVGASADFAGWHTDLDRHWREFALGYPDLLPENPDERRSILADIDGPRPVDLRLVEGLTMDLGGGVLLETLSAPGHLAGELGFLEHSTRTLLLGDSLIGTEWSFFHGYYDVEVYLATVERLRRAVVETPVAMLRAAHHDPMDHDQALAALDRVAAAVAGVDATVEEVVRALGPASLGVVWRQVCARLGKAEEFRGLRVVDAHLRSLVRRAKVVRTPVDEFVWSGD